MGRSGESFSKKEKEKKKLKKREEKERKKEERKKLKEEGGQDSMIAYVDAEGNLTDTPPDRSKEEEIDASSIELGIPKKEDVPAEDLVGKVDYFTDEKGYGFIRENKSQMKYFFHISQTRDEVREGDKVSFELEKGPKGLNAVRVKKI